MRKYIQKHRYFVRSRDGHKRPFHRFFRFLKRRNAVHYQFNREALAKFKGNSLKRMFPKRLGPYGTQ